MAINVKLQVFEGPLDLLLHLIEKNKVDIYDIPIVTITEQYLDYIRKMEQEDMDVMSEFLVMAATLIDIKCRMLLPREVNEEGEEVDPRAELVEKLLEYKLYKYMAEKLKENQSMSGFLLYHKKDLPKEVLEYEEPFDLDKVLSDVTLYKLQLIFHEVVQRQSYRIDPIRSSYGKIEKDEINIEEKTAYIEEYIRNHSVLSFRELLEHQGNRLEIIVTFLAVLELIKVGDIKVTQNDTDGDIFIERNY